MNCPHCGRPNVGWPITRPNKCSPKDWVNCIRNLEESGLSKADLEFYARARAKDGL